MKEFRFRVCEMEKVRENEREGWSHARGRDRFGKKW